MNAAPNPDGAPAAGGPATPRWLRASLWRQLLMPLVGLWVASALVATGAAYWFAGRTTNQSFDRLLADDAHALAAQLRWHDGAARFEASRETADLLVFDSLLRSHYTVRTDAGRTLVGNLALPLPLPELAGPFNQPVFFNQAAEGGLMLRAVALHVRPSVADEPVWVVVAESKTKRQQVTNEIALAIFLPAGLAGFVIIPLLYYGIRRGLAPTRHISALVVQHGENDLSPLSVDEVPEELRGLVQHTNALLSRLKASVEEQRRFVADAAHQLQTPMAGIRLLVGDMRRTQRADPSQPMDAEVLAQLDEVAARGARMVRQLLAYARAEEESVIEDQVFDAAAVTGQTVQRWQAAAAAAGKALLAPAEPPGQPGGHALRGSPTLLGEVISNLIDNALRYGGARVTVQLLARGARLHIRVCDDGPTLDAATRERMLLPFWRGQHGQTEGSGLGLSIAQRVIQRMGGRITVDAGPQGRGTCVDLDLPLSQLHT
ncbi:MAG: sensor histidine kinase [Proteobacteria bacterium]|nr:sensor histidine kinase [Pseudomonadota bacterium]